MSKNIYRVKKKSDLDEIIRKNFYKPICIIFISKSSDNELYDNLCLTLIALSKNNSYNMIVVIDFDDFIDNINYFESIKNNLPYFMAYFKGKQIGYCDNADNFIPLITNHIEQIHSSYLDKLISIFNSDSNTQHNYQDNNNEYQGPKENQENNENNEYEEQENQDNQVNEENQENQKNHDNKENNNDNNEDDENNEDNENINDEIESETEIETENTEMIRKQKERLKKLKKLKELQKKLNS